MAELKTIWYDFGPFRAFPTDYRLFREGVPVHLFPKSFDILAVLLERAPHLVSWQQLRREVWPDQEFLAANTVSTQLGAVRRALDHRDGEPYIQVVRARGVRFVVTPTRHESGATPKPVAVDPPIASPFLLECHRFIPTYLGQSAPTKIGGTACDGGWGRYHATAYPAGRLCVFPCGMGVWHLVDRLPLDSITGFAKWRAAQYHTIDNGVHPICGITRSLCCTSETRADPLAAIGGFTPYTLHVAAVHQHSWSAEQVRSAVRLLASPRALEASEAGVPRYYSPALEKRYLTEGFEHAEIHSFGVGPRHGFACWSGVALLDPAADSVLLSSLVEYEISLQSLWHLSHSLREALVHDRPPSSAALKPHVRTIRRRLAQLTAVGPRDDAQRRLMMEAVLATSRLQTIAADVLAGVPAAR